MNRRRMILIIALVLFTFYGCGILTDMGGASDISAGKVIPPSGVLSPFEGKWEVIKELGGDSEGEDEKNKWEGGFVQFSGDLVAIDDTVWEQTTYKIKKVDASEFVSVRGVPLEKYQDVTVGKVDVVTIYASGNYLGESMRIDDNSMILFIRDKELMLDKVSDMADNLSDISVASINSIANSIGRNAASGVLLGLRIPEVNSYVYRTLWIASTDNEIRPILVSDDIFFPRTSGFWELKVMYAGAGDDDSDNGGSYDDGGNVLVTRNIAVRSSEESGENRPDPNGDYSAAKGDVKIFDDYDGDYDGEHKNSDYKGDYGNDGSIKIVNFIGNDYISIEKQTMGSSFLSMLPVEKPSPKYEISIDSLLGESGKEVFSDRREQVLETLRNEEKTGAIVGSGTAGSFGIARQNGHWQLVGRVNYLKDGTIEHRDFNLKIIPPTNMIYYDTLGLSWYKIKDRVPDALDAFTSPDKGFAIVKTRSKLLVFKIGPGQLSEFPLVDIPLNPGTEVIMSEWATGSYVENWEESFVSYGAELLADR